MKAKHTDLEKLEQLYKESGNQLVVLYGRRGCQKEELIKEFCGERNSFTTDADRHRQSISLR